MTARWVEDIRLEQAADEILALKLGTSEAHALNQSAAVVFELCDGKTSKAEMAAAIRRRTGLPADEQIVDLALTELVDAGLVVLTVPPPRSLITRRSLIQRLSLSAAAMMMLPVVETILVPPMASAMAPQHSDNRDTSSANKTTKPTKTAKPTKTPTPRRTPTAGTGGGIIAVADSYVQQKDPKRNFGSKSELIVDGTDDPREAYLRFIVSGITDPIQRVVVRLYVTSGSKDGPRLYQAANSTWTENGLTWNNRPGATGPVLGNVGKVSDKTWVEYDVTTVVNGNGTYSFVLFGDGTESIEFASRESSNKPQLCSRLWTYLQIHLQTRLQIRAQLQPPTQIRLQVHPQARLQPPIRIRLQARLQSPIRIRLQARLQPPIQLHPRIQAHLPTQTRLLTHLHIRAL